GAVDVQLVLITAVRSLSPRRVPYTTLFRSELGSDVRERLVHGDQAALGPGDRGRPGGLGGRRRRARDRPGHLAGRDGDGAAGAVDRKSTRLNSSHVKTSYAVLCSKNKKNHL